MNTSEIGRHVMVGFAGTQVSDELRYALVELGAGGVILFTRNFEEPAQLRELAAEMRELSVHDRLWIGVDQEGGTVQRFRAPFTVWPDMASFAEAAPGLSSEALKDPKRREQATADVRKFARFLADELRAVDVDWNFAPVADLNTNPDSPVIGRRAFHEDPDYVAAFVAAFIQSTQSQGMLACAKHFPGHGATTEDSHTALPILDIGEDVLNRRELAPFRAAAEAGVASIMTAHVLYPALDEVLPATLSPRVIPRLLRPMPYEGVVVSDDFEMAAIAEGYDLGEAAVLAMKAGCDVILCCHKIERQEAIVRGLYDAVLREDLPRKTLWASDGRLKAMSERFPPRPLPPLAVIGRQEHLDLAERIREGSRYLE